MSDALKRRHQETLQTVQRAAAAPYGCAMEIVRQAGYWRDEAADEAANEGAEGLPVWEVEVEVSIAATGRLEIEAETAEQAKKLAREEARALSSFDFDHEEICDIVVGSVTKG